MFIYSGPMMKLVYKLQAEEYKYEMPISYLPVSPHEMTTAYNYVVFVCVPYVG